jgi:hypothetical protein
VGEAVIEHVSKDRDVGLGDEREVDEDALGERGVLLEAQAPAQRGLADEPEGEVVAAVEVEATEAVDLVEELVAEPLSFVEDDDRDDPALVDEAPRSLPHARPCSQEVSPRSEREPNRRDPPSAGRSSMWRLVSFKNKLDTRGPVLP